MTARSKFGLHTEIRERLRFEALLADISAGFVSLPAGQVDAQIESALRRICRCLGVAHSSVWQVPAGDPGRLVLSHYYRNSKLPLPPAHMSAAEYFPWAQSKLLANRVVCVPNTAKAPPEAARDAASWIQYGVGSTLGFPLSAGGGPVIGVLTFDHVREPREWPAPLQKRLRLIAEVFANVLERKFVEQKLLESEARLTLAAHAAGAGLWTLDVANKLLWTTATTRRLFGLQPDEPLDFETFISMIHPEDTEAVQSVVRKAMLDGQESSIEYRITRSDGRMRWMMSRGCRYSYGSDGPPTLMGVTVDISKWKRTELDRIDLGRRLLEAQEAERCRIARELHDEIGQAMALLRMGLQEAGKSISQLTGTPSRELSQLSDKAGEIARKISQISHELHSSQLEYLGLRIAIRSACLEFTEKQHIPVDFDCERFPERIGENTALCFFRIVQEALHNIVKHSGAREVKVNLAGSGDELVLSIADDGCGFDVRKAARSAGLGLISMRERMHMIGGRFELISKPGEGTKIRACAPIGTPPDSLSRMAPVNKPAKTLVETKSCAFPEIEKL